VAGELVILAWLRRRFFRTSFARSFLAITVGGVISAVLSSALGIAAGG
jgi:erythrin-vacuolar iron transport family protein